MATTTELLGAHAQEWTDATGATWMVVTHWALLDGRAECVGLELRSFAGDKSKASPLRPGSRITPVRSDTLRGLRLRDLLDGARETVANLMAEYDFGLSPSKRRRVAAAFGRSGKVGRPPLPLEELEEVARVYRSAARAPTRAVQEHFTISYAAADARVRAARRAGVLPPTEQGRSRTTQAKKGRR